MNQLEARIRDYLADHLTLIESGLVLVRKEFQLANAAGAGGSVDILARDVLGHYVVIEIKRSDQTARSALHELTKYVALLKSTLGIRSEQIRALLLSTDWHELSVPFAEYQRVCEVPTEGLVLVVQPEGVVTGVTVAVPPVMDRPLSISREQFVYLYEEAGKRDTSVPRIVDAARQALLKDFAILALDYSGPSQRAMYPHAAWFVFSSPLAGLTPEAAANVKAALPWDDELDEEDENFLIAMHGVPRDSAEIGYPEKLASLIGGDWRYCVAHRDGRYAANTAVLSDSALVAEAARLEGGAYHYMDATASPRYAPSWKKFKQDGALVLRGNPAWSAIFDLVMKDVQERHQRATVSAHIYNLANIVFSLTKLFAKSDPRYMPNIELLTSDPDAVVFHQGFMVWNGQRPRMDGREWIERAYGSIEDFMFMWHFGDHVRRDSRACRLLGLSSIVLEVRRTGITSEEGTVFTLSRGKPTRTPADTFAMPSMAEFCESNVEFGSNLVSVVTSFTNAI